MATPTRALGIRRVSKVAGRGDALQSLKVQSDQIERYCDSRGWKLLETLDEPDVSGHAKLADRHALGPAVEALQSGRADVIVFGEHDRAFRNLKEQWAIVELIEEAGGELHCADLGLLAVDNGTDDEWFNGSLHGLLTEKQWRVIRRKSMAGQAKAIEDGKVPVMLIPGLRRSDDGAVEIDPKRAGAVTEAFRLRDKGATIAEVRKQLRRRGIERSHGGTSALLKSRQAVGEISFGDKRLPAPALVARDTFERVQKQVVPRGPKSRSERLLARLGVLRCATCDARMVVGTSNNSAYFVYRCPSTSDCPRRVSISAPKAEEFVAEWVKAKLEGIEETASTAAEVGVAAEELERAQERYDTAMRMLDPDEPAAQERLTQLRAERDVARERHERARDLLDATEYAVSAADWPSLSLKGRRDLIRAVLERVEVSPGRGADRFKAVPKGA